MSVIDRLPLDKVSNIKIRNKHHIQNFQTYLPTATFACCLQRWHFAFRSVLSFLVRIFQSQNY